MQKDIIEHCRTLSDEELSGELNFHAEREKRNLASLLAHLGEFDRRRLPQKSGHESTFMYCVRVLRYDEGGAYRRVHAARVIRKYPKVLDAVADGSLTLTSLILLSPILNEDNHAALFQEARGKSKREVELLVAAHDPRPPVPDSMRRLPAPPAWYSRPPLPPASTEADSPSDPTSAPAQSLELHAAPPREWQAIMPLSIDRVRIGFDAAIALMRLIDRARQVLRHKYPEGRLEDIVTDALQILLDRKDPQRKLALKTPSLVRDSAADAREPRFLREMRAGRYIPAWVKRAVWQRDDGRCAWRFEEGTLCGSRDGIEYDHIQPVAKGGRSDSPRNVRLLCRLHNREAAEAAGLLSAAPAPS